MSVLHFRAEEVLQMAEALEEKGGRFYRRSAELFPELRELFLDLARMEDEHLETFRSLRASLPEGAKAIMDEETLHYLNSWASSHLFTEDPSDALTTGITPQEVLRMAIRVERDSIAFYQGLEEVVPQGWGREKVREVIREERRHLATLSERLRGIGG